MVKIIWHDNATFMLGYHLEYARIEFGESTMKRWKTEIAAFEERVKAVPRNYRCDGFGDLCSNKRRIFTA